MTENIIHGVWNYFLNDEDNDKTKCQLCTKEYNNPLKESTAKNHISSKHPLQWNSVRVMARSRKVKGKGKNVQRNTIPNGGFKEYSVQKNVHSVQDKRLSILKRCLMIIIINRIYLYNDLLLLNMCKNQKKMIRKKRDEIWNYFHESSDKKKHICNNCKTSYSEKTSISSMKKHYQKYHDKEFKEMDMKNKKMKFERKNKNKNRSQKISKIKKERKNNIIINYDVSDTQLKEGKFSQIMLEDVIVENVGFFKQQIEFKSINFSN
ncbi:786_t:CDS:2 [Cetraspora pellucida]|uniref:786_t:CDS:1 n=1 Tax=Cetraspora pellucida TaxID=1433469 RepID=A0ACA9KB44_9GLOM|nr:786_t:CDS:2 [Cetraspora pellucida]